MSFAVEDAGEWNPLKIKDTLISNGTDIVFIFITITPQKGYI